MKKSLSRIAIVVATFAFVTLLVTSCKKDEKKLSRTELISRSWIQIDLIASTGTLSQSIFDQEVPVWHQDDIFEFKSDGTFIVTEGATRENPTDPDVVTTGTWQFIDSETKIVVDPANEGAETLTIEELTTTSFKGYLIDNSQGFDIKVTTVLQAK